MLTEIDIPNPDGALSPGIYCTIEFHIPRKTPSLSVPADVIIFNRNTMLVAVVSDGKAEIRKVGVKRDLGTRVEVDSVNQQERCRESKDLRAVYPFRIYEAQP